MNIEDLRNFCLSLPEVTEAMPWVERSVYSGGLCFYVCGKWFCFCDVDDFRFINIKLPPQTGKELRERYDAVRPGWHMNKVHWNSVYIDSDLSDGEILDLVRQSYDTVAAHLPLKERVKIKPL